MPLEKSLVPLNIFQPANQKTDAQSLAPGTLTKVENAKFNKGNRFDKTNGFSALTMTDKDATALTDVKKIIGTQNHLLAWSGNSVYSYNRGKDLWNFVGPYYACSTDIRSVDESGGSAGFTNAVYLNGYIYCIYEYTDTSTFSGDYETILTVYDASSFEVSFGPRVIGTGRDPRLLVHNSKVFAFYFDEANETLKAKELGPSLTDWQGTEQSLFTDMQKEVSGSDPRSGYDVYNWSDTRIVVVYNDTTTLTTTNIRYFDDSLTELTGAYALRQVTGGPTTLSNIYRIMASSSGDRFFVIASYWRTGANLTKYFIINSDGTLNTGFTSLTDPVDFDYISGIAIKPYNDGSNDGVKLWWSGTDIAGGWIEYIRVLKISDGGTETVITAEASNGSLVIGDPVTIDSVEYFLTYRGSDLVASNNSFQLQCFDGSKLYTVSQVLWGRGIWALSMGPTQKILSIGSNKYVCLATVRDTSDSPNGVVLIEFDFSTDNLFNGIQIGQSCLISGTNPHIFDGSLIKELGFFQQPLSPTISQSTGGFLADGVYQLVLVPEYKDRNGLVQRGFSSPIRTLTISGGSGNASINVVVKYMNATNLPVGDDIESFIRLIPYLTEAGGSIFYRVEGAYTTNEYFINDPMSITTTWNLDSVLGNEPILYTDSGEIEPTPIPPLKYLTVWNNRLWGSGEPENKLVFYSKLTQNDIAPELTESLAISIQDIPSSVTGIKGFQDKIVLVCRDRIYYSYGAGPDNTGQGGDFAQFEQVLGITGAINNDSIAINSQGLWLKSDKGIYLLNAGLSVEYAGAVFEDDTNTSILKALVDVKKDVVHFITASGIVQLDYFFNNWSKSTGITFQDGCIYNNDLYILDDSDQVYRYDTSVYKIDTTSYGMLIESGWINFAQLVGFQRFYRLFIKATYKSSHSLKVSLAYDYSSTYLDSVTIDPTDATDDDVYRFIVYPTKQKCQSFRIKIEEIITDGTSGTHESLQLNFIGVQVGLKRGLPKIKDAQKVGVTNV